MTDFLLESDAPRDPLTLFAAWYEAAQPKAHGEPTAVTLATADATGRPSARVVLLKGYDPRGFVFFTNYMSRKGADLEANPCAALLFRWPLDRRQVRVEGRAERIAPAESDAYFQSRSRGSQLGAWASEQSRAIRDRAVLDKRFEEFDRKFAAGPVPRPPHWGGYRVIPDAIEFWQNRDDRLHDRLLYRRDNGGWRIERLNP